MTSNFNAGAVPNPNSGGAASMEQQMAMTNSSMMMINNEVHTHISNIFLSGPDDQTMPEFYARPAKKKGKKGKKKKKAENGGD